MCVCVCARSRFWVYVCVCVVFCWQNLVVIRDALVWQLTTIHAHSMHTFPICIVCVWVCWCVWRVKCKHANICATLCAQRIVNKCAERSAAVSEKSMSEPCGGGCCKDLFDYISAMCSKMARILQYIFQWSSKRRIKHVCTLICHRAKPIQRTWFGASAHYQLSQKRPPSRVFRSPALRHRKVWPQHNILHRSAPFEYIYFTIRVK